MKRFITIIFFLVFGLSSTNSQEVSWYPNFLIGFDYYEDDIRISGQEFKSLMQRYPEVNKQYQEFRRHKNTAYISLVGWTASIIGFGISVENNKGTELIWATSFATFSLFVIIFGNTSKKELNKTINKYNIRIRNERYQSLILEPSKEGVGISLRF